jgi:hypothetical protein
MTSDYFSIDSAGKRSSLAVDDDEDDDGSRNRAIGRLRRTVPREICAPMCAGGAGRKPASRMPRSEFPLSILDVGGHSVLDDAPTLITSTQLAFTSDCASLCTRGVLLCSAASV